MRHLAPVRILADAASTPAAPCRRKKSAIPPALWRATPPVAGMNATCRPRDKAELSAALEQARARLLAMIADLDDAQLIVPHRQTLNPFLWEVGHPFGQRLGSCCL